MYPKIQTSLKLDMASQGRFPRARNVSVMARLSTRRLEEIRRLLYLKFKKKSMLSVVNCSQGKLFPSFLIFHTDLILFHLENETVRTL